MGAVKFKFNIGDSVNVTEEYFNDSQNTRKEEGCFINGVYGLKSWENAEFSISKRKVDNNNIGDSKDYKTYQLTLEGKVVGWVYEEGLKKI